jgi:hypothetical protein
VDTVRRRSKRHAMSYLVGIPIPYLDRRGKRLAPSKTKLWIEKAALELTGCFGGATPLPAPGVNVVEGQVLYEKGQILVLSACQSREDFLPHRERIAAFAERMGFALDQDAVFVLAFPSDSLLIELPAPEPKETSQ